MKTCRLEDIFKRQHELFLQFRDIEKNNGVGYGILGTRGSFDVQDWRGQALCKDYAWRIVEEACEAADEALEITGRPELAQEEVIDVLHFIIELLMLNGITTRKLGEYLREETAEFYNDRFDLLSNLFRTACVVTTPTVETKKHAFQVFIRAVGRAMHLLRARPWKRLRGPMLDEKEFHRGLMALLISWTWFATNLGLDDNKTYIYYYGKAAVNMDRIQRGL